MTEHSDGPPAKGAVRDAARVRFLSGIIPKHCVGAELGVHKGRFARRLFDVLGPEELHLIDPWWLRGKKAWSWGKGKRSVFDAFGKVLRRFESELVAGTVKIHIGYDMDALPLFPDHFFDWVYLDTSHTYEQTAVELELLSRKVKEDGFIAGDDWHPDPEHKHHGVYAAVDDFLHKTPYRLVGVCEASHQWCVTRASQTIG